MDQRRATRLTTRLASAERRLHILRAELDAARSYSAELTRLLRDIVDNTAVRLTQLELKVADLTPKE